MATILIAHSASDAAAADALDDFLHEAMEVPRGGTELTEISTGGGSADLMESLKADIAGCDAVAALIPSDPAGSRDVMFQLGAAWSMEKMIFMFFMPGIDFREVPEVLAAYPSVEVGSSGAHIAMMDIAREIADFTGMKERKDGNALDAIMRIERTASGTAADETPEDEFGFNSPTRAAIDDVSGDDHVAVVVTYEEVSLSGPTGGRISIRMTWNELFKSFAPYIASPQDDEYVKKLIVEHCKGKDPAFLQNVTYGMYKRTAIEPYCYQRIIERFSSAGLIAQVRPPRSAFTQKSALRVYWRITDRGEDLLRGMMTTEHALQKWNGAGVHIPRGAVRPQPKPES